MKSVYVILFVTIVNFNGFSQSYTPLLDNFNEWHVTSCFFGCSTDKYYTDGDTVVNGLDYKILDGFHYISRSFLLREDIPAKQVYLYFIFPDKTSGEYLLYDFSLNEGDTFEMKNPISPFPPNPGNFILDSIRFKPLVDGNNYKHFYFTPIDPSVAGTTRAIWVEGVGSLSIINAPGGDPDFNGAGELNCFFKNSDLFYSNLDSINECTPLFVADLPQKKEPILTIYPTYVNIECLVKSEVEMKSIEVLTINGAPVFRLEIDDMKEVVLSFDNIPSGVYILKTTFSNGAVNVRKIVKS